MQRMPPNMPPKQSRQNGAGLAVSPALNMAQRIRSEQGLERAREYLMDMEPYLAPAERSFIAEQMGLTLPQRRREAPAAPPQTPDAGGPSFTAPGAAQGGVNAGFNPMQLLQMLSGMGGAGGQHAGGMQNMGNLMQMAQMMQTLGPLLGGKK